MSESLTGPVHVIGTGLLGTSIGLALRNHGIEVWLSDRDPGHLRTAAGLGAGMPHAGGVPQLVVVAVPPEYIGSSVLGALDSGAPVTDVGSVKAQPLQVVGSSATPEQAARYVGGHPMAGSERSGPLAASSSLFEGRPWAITPTAGTDPLVVELAESLARLCGAVVVRMSPAEHDEAVARISHLPHLMSVLVASQLADADPAQLALSGQGVRDVTRIAAGEPALWQQIIGANAVAIRDLLTGVRSDLDRLLAALDEPEQLRGVLATGVRGTRAIPGKHGGPALPTASVYVAVPDHPGELARLLADVGTIGTNLEDLRIDHDPGRPVGLVELVVAASGADALRDALESRNWVVHR